MKKMKKIYSLLALAFAFVLTGCIDETFPESDSATQEQVEALPSAFEATLRGISAKMVEGYLVYGDQEHETDMSYPQFMLAQTEMLGDIFPGDEPGYDWYQNYNTFSRNFGEDSYFAYLPFFTIYQLVKCANDVIGAVDLESSETSSDVRGMAGQAYAARAFFYYLGMVFFEPVENIYTDVSAVKGLTIPIVTEKTTQEEAKNNPRATHDEMVKFILSDLDIAEQCLSGDYKPSSKLLPNLAVVYGIKAKVYLWDEDYANAAKYARMAIDLATTNGATPMTATQWEDPNSAFAVAAPSWMWYVHYDAENMRNLANWTGWISPEAQWSYSYLYMPCIDKSLYDKIAKTDFRKNVFLHPDRYKYYNYKTSMSEKWIKETCKDYTSLKFRCVGGNTGDYAVGGTSDVPVMRIEEMYLIEAEAVGVSQGVAEGVRLLNDFMVNYRDPAYNYNTSVLRNLQLEVLTQMRIEFWGEGNAFPSAKRLKPDVIQNYNGTNAPSDIYKINCKGIKPNWNLCIPIYEINSNRAIKDHNNPNPTQTVEGPTPIGQFAPGNN